MISAFDLEKLQTLLKDFYTITQIRITVFDDQVREILSYPEKIAPICGFIRNTPAAAHACHQCDLEACRQAARLHRTHVYHCHAGLTEAAAPVFLGNIPVAYLLFGHLFSYQNHYEGWTAVKAACAPYHLDEQTLRQYVIDLPVTPEETILSASHILQAVAAYLCMDRMITLKEEDLPTRIDDYISAHFAEDIDAAFLCEKFQIGKTALYEISRRSYGKGIAGQIRSLRIEYAKKCLTEYPDMSISQVAERCGFCDYNYFITVFKKYTGTSPRKYRNVESVTVTDSTV